jgi:hypothetical protein
VPCGPLKCVLEIQTHRYAFRHLAMGEERGDQRGSLVRISFDLPCELHGRVHEAAARKGCSARKLILAGIERAVEEAKSTRPSRRLSLDPPLIRPAGRRIRITNEQAYEFIELP